jgi:hypothetical protein
MTKIPSIRYASIVMQSLIPFVLLSALSWQQFEAPPAERHERELYPWELGYVGEHPRITKEYFRCKGSSVSPMRTVSREGEEVQYLHDCGGCKRHGLPLFDGEEGVYPILIDLINHVQEKTGKRVIITCGHRCPDHNTYSDPSKFNQNSKHMVGAEVDFYVQGMEEQTDEVIALLLDFYADASEASYRDFKRYTKDNTDVATPPWYNKEVFIKLYERTEGRDYDNRHPYPYVGIQVRYDRQRSEWVAYTWKAAHYNYRRE